MGKQSRAEEYLVEQIRAGDSDAWAQLVDRYQGRLLSYATGRLRQRADAEDIVQDTFIAFVRSLGAYRGDSGLESYLFSILRRKIIDVYRSNSSNKVCLIQDTYNSDQETSASGLFANIAGSEMTGSWYVKRDEQKEKQLYVLSGALEELVSGYKKDLNFRELMIVELLFYCQLTNRDIAKIVEVDNSNIGVIKHRCLAKIKDYVANKNVELNTDAMPECVLTEVWEIARPSCPKRSTIGAYMLGTLDEQWRKYVDDHLNKLGCHFCRANLDDLKSENEKGDQNVIQLRIMESTVGFLKKV